MRISENFLKIAKIEGVDQYIFTDSKGNIADHDIKDPQTVSAMVFSCGQNIRTIGNKKFRYAVFSRENKKDLIIFPVGNYSLGVVKQKDTQTVVLVENILNFLHELLGTVIHKREKP